MVRIVFLKSRTQFKGGLEKYTHHLVRAFYEKGCHVTLLTTGEAPKLEGISTISLAPNSKFTLYQLPHFNSLCNAWLKNNPQDIVFGMERTTHHTHYRAGNGVHAMYLKRRKLVDSLFKRASASINPLHRTILTMEKRAFESSDLKVLFTNSFMVKEEILQTYSTPTHKIDVVHNGVEWKKWQLPFEQSLNHKKRGPYHLLFIGNGYRRKGLFFLLEGLKKIRNEDFILTVIGKDKNISYYENWTTQHNLNEKVQFLGPQEDVLPFYQRADALVIPSIYDPFANVTVEALAMGLFVISSPFNGGKEVLQSFSGHQIDELTSADQVAAALKKAFSYPKSETSACMIRQSIKDLDFSNQLDKIVCKTLQI